MAWLGTVPQSRFLVDMGATYSVLNTKVTKESLDIITVTGVTEQLQKEVFLQHLEFQLGDKKIAYNFWYMPYLSIPLLGEDLLCKLHT